VTAAGAEAGSDLAAADPDGTTVAADASPIDIDANEQAKAQQVVTAVSRTPRLLLRGIISAILAVLAGAAAWLLWRHGIRTDDFPPFLTGTPSTPITRYSGPWITAAAGAAFLAALLLLSAVLDVVRWSRAVREGAE
jgi:hypothetical protein